MIRRLAPALALAMLAPALASAQTPGMPPAGGPTGEDEPKPEGVAEKAPREPGQLPTTPTLPPWPGAKRKKFELFELDGYFRVRTDWLSNFHLGFHNESNGTPFREPLSCLGMVGDCSDSIGTANMRVRLEPVINLSEQVALHLQIDVLDNVVLGSTPDGVFREAGVSAPGNVPINAFTGGQAPPEAGRNYAWDSIRVKRAWGEVKVPDVGVLRFGRMPSHWGLGILANGGGYDAMRGTTCLDCDHGDSADRIMFGTMIPGTKFRAAIAMDWASSEPTSAQTDIWRNRYDGQPYDLDDADDVRQWVFVLARLDGVDEWRDTIEQGELGLNYGVYFVYRAQDYEARTYNFGGPAEGTLEHRAASAYIPDAYFRLGYKKLLFEAEAALIYGFIDDLSDFNSTTDQKIFQLGGVARLNYLLLDDDLNLGIEVGFASGDQWDPSQQGTTNVRDGITIPGAPGTDDTISNFRFDFDYHVDLILFRELLGTVTNATYVKPNVQYNVTNRFIFRAAGIMSFAHVPVSTPGNELMYGIELDGDLGYENRDEGFFAGISYGVFFPLGAMDHPAALGYTAGEQGDAETAQTIQTRLVLKF